MARNQAGSGPAHASCTTGTRMACGPPRPGLRDEGGELGSPGGAFHPRVFSAVANVTMSINLQRAYSFRVRRYKEAKGRRETLSRRHKVSDRGERQYTGSPNLTWNRS